MRIVLVCPMPPPYGGITNWSKMLISHLEDLGKDQLSIIDISPKTRSVDGQTLFDRVFGGVAVATRAVNELKKLLGKETIDVVHITTSGGLGLFRDIAILNTARKAGVPVVYHIHYGGVPATLAADSHEAALLKTALKRCSMVVAIDRATEYAIRETDLCKVIRLGNPVDIDELESLHVEDIFEETKTVVYLGWLIETKGIRELVDAWSSVTGSFPDWRLELIGPYDSDSIESLVGDAFDGSMTLLGELSHNEAMKHLQKSSMLVLPSYSEGFPNVVLEAMAYGKPVLATGVGALPDLLSDGRGIVVEPRSVGQITEGLNKLMKDRDLRNLLGERAAQYVRHNYTIDRVAGQYRELWMRLSLEKHSGSFDEIEDVS